MGAVSYGQAGYVGTSMSVRARAAYESGADAGVEVDAQGNHLCHQGLLR